MLARAFSPSTLRQKQVDSGSRTRVNKLGDKYLYLGGNAFIFCAILIAPKITLRMTGTQKNSHFWKSHYLRQNVSHTPSSTVSLARGGNCAEMRLFLFFVLKKQNRWKTSANHFKKITKKKNSNI